MLSREDFESLVNGVKEKINETDSALVSEDLLGVLSSYKSAVDEIDSLKEQSSKLKKDNDELLKVNGKLFQKIGFDKEVKTETKFPEEKQEEPKIDLNDIIDEKGDFK